MGSELDEILALLLKTGEYKINEEHYKRVPKGYDDNHKRAGLLRHNAFYIHTRNIGQEILSSPALVNVCFEHFQEMLPVKQWLAKVIQQ
ncbi:DUF2461 family protein [Cohnella silvisoli]|uniref:DUF2461 family protein n=1 Tax=Cohnella silvisoli TaxID=2873699 RepID=UPI003D7EF715